MAARRFAGRARGRRHLSPGARVRRGEGLRGSNLDAMRLYHADIGVEGPLAALERRGRSLPMTARTARTPARRMRSFASKNGRLILPSFTTRYENALDGHSRGVELVVRRRSPNGLSGWMAYNLAFT